MWCAMFRIRVFFACFVDDVLQGERGSCAVCHVHVHDPKSVFWQCAQKCFGLCALCYRLCKRVCVHVFVRVFF